MFRKTFIPHRHSYKLWRVVGDVLYFRCDRCRDGHEGHIYIVPKSTLWTAEAA